MSELFEEAGRLDAPLPSHFAIALSQVMEGQLEQAVREVR